LYAHKKERSEEGKKKGRKGGRKKAGEEDLVFHFLIFHVDKSQKHLL